MIAGSCHLEQGHLIPARDTFARACEEWPGLDRGCRKLAVVERKLATVYAGME